jgi:D-3-phosphoglycerate dehydrogenase
MHGTMTSRELERKGSGCDGISGAGTSGKARVWTGPARPQVVLDAITGAGGVLVGNAQANVIVWTSEGYEADSVQALSDRLHPGVEWVQLDTAGIDHWLQMHIIDDERIWTRADYAPPVAEQVVGFLVAACRRFPEYARAKTWSPLGSEVLAGKTIGIVGCGRIGVEAIARLRPFGVHILALTDPVAEIDGADACYGPEGLHELLERCDHAVIALPLTDATRGVIGAEELALIGPGGWLINVGRGKLVDTDALVAMLRSGGLGGACLDVCDPEPLPDGHPLWDMDNVLITQHSANPELVSTYAKTVAENMRRFVAGDDLILTIDRTRGY